MNMIGEYLRVAAAELDRAFGIPDGWLGGLPSDSPEPVVPPVGRPADRHRLPDRERHAEFAPRTCPSAKHCPADRLDINEPSP